FLSKYLVEPGIFRNHHAAVIKFDSAIRCVSFEFFTVELKDFVHQIASRKSDLQCSCSRSGQAEPLDDLPCASTLALLTTYQTCCGDQLVADAEIVCAANRIAQSDG